MAQKRYTSADLQKWLVDKATAASTPQARKIIISGDMRSSESTIVGKMYFFKYDPLWKDKLEKYDRFPMVFPLEPPTNSASGMGFLGLNLHYLSLPERQALLERLLEYKNNKYMDQRTRLKLSYELISSTRKLNSLARPCVKRYLFSRCRSQFIEVYPYEYDKAIQLPVEDWVFRK